MYEDLLAHIQTRVGEQPKKHSLSLETLTKQVKAAFEDVEVDFKGFFDFMEWLKPSNATLSSAECPKTGTRFLCMYRRTLLRNRGLFDDVYGA